MTSLTAGSPSCNCKNPDTCIHAFTLKVKDRTFAYKRAAVSHLNRESLRIA